MRLFLALSPPSAVTAHLDAAVEAARAAYPSADVRWVPAERWHLTLAFYGEVADRDVARLRRRVARLVSGQVALDLSFTGAGRFGHRVLWIGMGGDVDGLRALGQRASVEDRSYRPHLTVARGRGGVDLTPAVDALAAYAGPPWRAGSVHLVESHLGPQPRYDDVEAWPLLEPA